MRTRELLPTLSIASTIALSVAACGTSSPSSPGSSGAPVQVALGGPVTVAGDGAVSTLILIDRTTLLHGTHALAMAYRQTALQVAAPTIARGGTLSVGVFGRVAAHYLSLYTVKIPTLSELGPAARDDAGQTAALAQVLNVGLGLTLAPDQNVQQQLATVTPGSGSDIGGAVAQAITALGGDPAPTHNALILTDGWIIEQGQPSLEHVLLHDGPSRAAALIDSDASTDRGTPALTFLRVAGLASTSGGIDPGAPVVKRLVATWQLACRHLPVRQCSVTAQS